MHVCLAKLEGALCESSEGAAAQLQHLQRSQIYLEQKMRSELTAGIDTLRQDIAKADERVCKLESEVWQGKARQ